MKWVIASIQVIIAIIAIGVGLSALGVFSLGFLTTETLGWLTGLLAVIAGGTLIFAALIHIE